MKKMNEFGKMKLRKLNMRKNRETRSILLCFSLTYEQIYKSNSLEDLEAFLDEDRFPFSKDCEEFLILIRRKPRNGPTESLSKRLRVESYSAFFARGKFRMVVHLIRGLHSISRNCSLRRQNFWGSLKEIYVSLESVLLEYTISDIAKRTDRVYLLATQTYMNYCPTFFHKKFSNITRVMLWYSVNNETISKIGEESSFELPSHLKDLIDMHYVWTVEQKKWLEKFGVRHVSVVGSMVFVPRKIFHIQSRLPRSLIPRRVAFFDVTPLTDGLGIYTEESCIATLSSIISVTRDISLDESVPIELCLKPKREYSQFHSKKYIGYLQEQQETGSIKLLDSRSNIYEEVDRASVVISVPYSSPSVVAVELGVPTIFFFQTKDTWDFRSHFSSIPVVLSTEVLRAWLRENL